MDSKNIMCHVNSSACRVYVNSQLHFRGHFRVHFRTSTLTFIRRRTATPIFYTYTHLWMYSGLYSATATFSRPFSCTFMYIHTYTHRGPSLALFSRWQRVHGYTSLIRPRLHSSLHSLHSTSTFSEHFRDPSVIYH